jgi:hypothetical protein
MPSTKGHFGTLLDMEQRFAVIIEKKDRPVAVMIAESEYLAYQLLKVKACNYLFFYIFNHSANLGRPRLMGVDGANTCSSHKASSQAFKSLTRHLVLPSIFIDLGNLPSSINLLILVALNPVALVTSFNVSNIFIVTPIQFITIM